MPERILQDLYWQGLGWRLLQSFAVWCLRCDAEMASGYSLWCQERILMEWWLSSMAADSRWVSSPALGIEHLSFWCNFNPRNFVGIRSEARTRATVGHHVPMLSIRLDSAKLISYVFYCLHRTCASSGTAVQLLAFTNLATCYFMFIQNSDLRAWISKDNNNNLNCQNLSILWDIL